MQEYDVNVLPAKDGLALSVNPIGSTGPAPYLTFSSWPELEKFFQSHGASTELIRQLDHISRCLKPGSVFKDRMFLSELLEEQLSSVTPIDVL